MFRKTLMLAVTVLAVTAVTVPAASAKWTHNHQVISSGTNPIDSQFTGQSLFQSVVVGGINCQTKTLLQLTGGQTTGHITSSGVDLDQAGSTPTTKCVTSGPISSCRVKEVISTNLPWTVHVVNPATLSITTGEVDNILESQTGGACGVVQQIKLKPGTAHWTITPGETCTIKEVHVTGQKETQTGAKVTLGGTKLWTPSKTYGTITSTAAADNGGVPC